MNCTACASSRHSSRSAATPRPSSPSPVDWWSADTRCGYSRISRRESVSSAPARSSFHSADVARPRHHPARDRHVSRLGGADEVRRRSHAARKRPVRVRARRDPRLRRAAQRAAGRRGGARLDDHRRRDRRGERRDTSDRTRPLPLSASARRRAAAGQRTAPARSPLGALRDRALDGTVARMLALGFRAQQGPPGAGAHATRGMVRAAARGACGSAC